VGVVLGLLVGVRVGVSVADPPLQLEELKSQKLVMFKATPVVVVVIWVPNVRSGLEGQPDCP
jgi:hypothetical protein